MVLTLCASLFKNWYTQWQQTLWLNCFDLVHVMLQKLLYQGNMNLTLYAKLFKNWYTRWQHILWLNCFDILHYYHAWRIVILRCNGFTFEGINLRRNCFDTCQYYCNVFNHVMIWSPPCFIIPIYVLFLECSKCLYLSYVSQSLYVNMTWSQPFT